MKRIVDDGELAEGVRNGSNRDKYFKDVPKPGWELKVPRDDDNGVDADANDGDKDATPFALT